MGMKVLIEICFSHSRKIVELFSWQITPLNVELSVPALTNGLRPYDFGPYGMWPIVDDVVGVVGWTGNSLKSHLKFGGARLIPRKMSTKTCRGKNRKVHVSIGLYASFRDKSNSWFD